MKLNRSCFRVRSKTSLGRLCSPIVFLWTGQTLANVGDIFYLVAFISYLYRVTESALFTSMVPVVFVCAQLLSSVCAPILFDRFSLKQILMISQAAKTLLLVGMTLVIMTGHGEANLFLLFLFVFAIALLDGVAAPSRNAWLPRLVTEQQLVKVNSIFASTDQAVQFIGWAFGGILVAFMDVQNVLWLTCGLYLLSTLSLLPIHEQQREQVEAQIQSTSKWESIVEGWRSIWDVPSLRAVVITEVLDGLAGGVWISAILLVYVKEALGLGEEWWGFLNASYFVGMIAGGLAVYVIGNRMNSRSSWYLVVSSLLSFVFTWGFGYTNLAWLAIGLSVALGPVHQIQTILKQTIVQQNCETGRLPKVLSARGTLQYVAFGVSVLVMSALVDHAGVTTAYAVSAGLVVLQTIYQYFWRHAFQIERAEG